ncbi:MAG: GTPase HflX [Synergistaceae bacterium]|jgi:GTP-binding protein HflX|nr:GTPase HflX [Synergistaceae bacterium]
MIDLALKPKSALIAAVDEQDGESEPALDELALLLSNLGVPVVGRVLQKRRTPDPATFIGKGKAAEIKEFAFGLGANLLVVDDELSPTQRSNLGAVTGLEVWDRAFTIMMIFEQRANTAEAKLQVELAMLRYEIPSLKGLGHQMSRLGGGIGTRGPGETEFERHRRKLERRIKFIEKNLKDVRNRRRQYRYRRSRDGADVVSLVGYTNSGKSTLLRSLSGDNSIKAEDRLFSTLDTVTRRVDVPSGDSFLLSDTVGFIRKLPPELIAAFRATLEEASGADLLLIVADASSPTPMRNFDVVLDTLRDIEADEIPRIVVLNKIDRVSEESVFISAGLESKGEDVARVSALSGEGLPELILRINERIKEVLD